MKYFIVIAMLFAVTLAYAGTQDTRVQVIFREPTQYGDYQDALWFTQDEYSKVTPEQINTMKQERLNKWLDIVSHPAPEPTKAEKLIQIQKEIDNANTMIDEFTQRADKLKSNKAELEQ